MRAYICSSDGMYNHVIFLRKKLKFGTNKKSEPQVTLYLIDCLVILHGDMACRILTYEL